MSYSLEPREKKSKIILVMYPKKYNKELDVLSLPAKLFLYYVEDVYNGKLDILSDKLFTNKSYEEELNNIINELIDYGFIYVTVTTEFTYDETYRDFNGKLHRFNYTLDINEKRE